MVPCQGRENLLSQFARFVQAQIIQLNSTLTTVFASRTLTIQAHW